MKKFLSLLMAVVATFSVLSFAVACEDGKCDECGSNKNVKVYEQLDNKEYCPACATEAALHAGINGIFGD